MIKCYDVAEEIFEEASKQFAPLFVENAEKKDAVKSYCEVIDRLAEEFNGESLEIDVEDISMKIHIRLGCPDVLIQSEDHELYQLAAFADSVALTHGDDGNLLIDFAFPGIWDKA